MMKMTSSEVVSVITQSAKRFPVTEWTAGGLQIWPLVALEAVRKNDWGCCKLAYPSQLATLRAKCGKVLSLAGRMSAALWSDRAKNASLAHPVDALLLSDGISFQLLNGLWYNKLCDPFIDELSSRGFGSLLLEQGYFAPVGCRTPSFLVQPRLGLARLKSLLAGKNRRINAPEYGRWGEFALSCNPDFQVPNLYDIARYTEIISAFREVYLDLFRKVKPKIGILANYYNFSGMGFVLACKEFGIPAMDIQHGFQGELHMAYNFNYLPPGKYDLLPQLFWVWEKADAQLIHSWGGGHHRALAGGNLFMRMWFDGDNPTVAAYDRQVEKIKSPGRRQVLYSIGNEDVGEVTEIARTIRLASEAGFSWWVRLHPGFLDRRDMLKAEFARLGLPELDLDTPTSLPLYSLLRHADVHLAKSSSTVMEAAQMGVPSVLAEQDAHAFFPEQIASGMAVIATTAEDIVAGLRAQCQKFPRTTVPKAGCSGGPAFDEVFAFASGAKSIRMGA